MKQAACWIALALGLSAISCAAPKRARTVMAPRDTAILYKKGAGQVGAVSAMRLGIADGVEGETAINETVLLAPNAGVRVRLHETEGFYAAAKYGLSVPTGSMWLASGYLYPTKSRPGGDNPGLFLVPSAATLLSLGDEAQIATFSFDMAVGIPIGTAYAGTFETLAPLELAFAPVNTGLRTHAGVLYDHSVTPWLRLRGSLDVYYIGGSQANRSPFMLSLQAGADLKLYRTARLVLGAALFDSDQGATIVQTGANGFLERVPVRSQDVVPVLDVVWSWDAD